MAADATSTADPVAHYKALLRSFIDRRPSGLRGRVARALGKHKSFVTQITSPAYAAPIPATDVRIILDTCHLSREERAEFLAAYRQAHPGRGERIAGATRPKMELRIALPSFRNPATARHVEALIVDFAERVVRLAKAAEAPAEAPALSEKEPPR